MSTTIKLIMGNVYTKVESADGVAINELTKDMSRRIPGFKHSNQFKNGLWDGSVKFLDKGYVLTGLTEVLIHYIDKHRYTYELVDNRIDPMTEVHPVNLKGGRGPREYQWDAIEAIITHKRGAVAASTNSGKTLIACGAIQATGVKTLFLTHRDELFTQTDESFEKDLGHPVGNIWGDNMDLDKHVTIAMVPTLARRLEHPTQSIKKLTDKLGTLMVKKSRMHKIMEAVEIEKAEKSILTTQKQLDNKKTTFNKDKMDWETLAKYLQSIEMVIIDESHHCIATSYEDILSLCEKAYYRIGLSGTPFEYEDETKTLKSIGLLGPTIFSIDNNTLIDKGVSSTPECEILYVNKPIVADDYNLAYKKGIILNPERNKLILGKCKEYVEKKLPTLIVINYEEHGEHLLNFLIKGGISPDDVKFISGNTKNRKHRAEYFQKFKAGKLPILIASLIVQEGVSMDSIGALIFALGGKSDIRVLQVIGRGLRQNKYGNIVKIIDFFDMTNKYLVDHSFSRWDTYQRGGFEKYFTWSGELPFDHYDPRMMTEVMMKYKANFESLKNL